jgi:hypothetical protein
MAASTGQAPSLLGDNMAALTQSLLPSVRMANNVVRAKAQNQVGHGQSPNGFDFMAGLRKLESRAKEYDRRLGGGDASSYNKRKQEARPCQIGTRRHLLDAANPFYNNLIWRLQQPASYSSPLGGACLTRH